MCWFVPMGPLLDAGSQNVGPDEANPVLVAKANHTLPPVAIGVALTISIAPSRIRLFRMGASGGRKVGRDQPLGWGTSWRKSRGDSR